MTAVLIVLGLIAIVVGILGTIYPALPGLGLMFGGAWLLGYAGDYQVFGSGTLTFLAIVAVFGTAMDYVAGALGAKYTGASKTAVWGAFIGGIVGAFFSIPGLLLGPLQARPSVNLSHAKTLGRQAKSVSVRLSASSSVPWPKSAAH